MAARRAVESAGYHALPVGGNRSINDDDMDDDTDMDLSPEALVAARHRAMLIPGDPNRAPTVMVERTEAVLMTESTDARRFARACAKVD